MFICSAHASLVSMVKYFNYRCHIKTEWNGSPMIFQTKNVNYSPYYQLPCMTQLTSASTHCSSCFGSLDDYRIKSISNSEPIRNPLQTNNASILERVRSCKDFWLRTDLDKTMELLTSVDMEIIPKIVSTYPQRWPHLLGKGPLYDLSYTDEQEVKAEELKHIASTISVPMCLTENNSCVRPHYPNPETVTCPVTKPPESTSTGAYIIPENYLYRFDQQFADAILNNIISGSVLELGAGSGCYTYYFKNSGLLSHVSGFEGAANVHELSGGLIKHADLAEKQDFGSDFDWVVSLEVAEHIPIEYEATFVENLIISKPKGILLSWALPDQPGSGHVNGRTNDYVISLMKTKGYEFDAEKTSVLRDKAQLGWFKKTTMVFNVK